MQFGVADAVIGFNEGSIAKSNDLERLGIKPGKFMTGGMSRIDQNRNKEVQGENKKKRFRRILIKT